MEEGKKDHPSAAKIGEIRKGVLSHFPRATRMQKKQTYPEEPTKRAIINAASELYRQEQELRKQEGIDPLTGLLSPTGFDRIAENEVKIAKETGKTLAIIFLDLNELKLINDTLGHDVGDERIKAVASLLKASVSANDHIARKGEKADEFAILMQITSPEQIEQVYTRIKEGLTGLNQNWGEYPIFLPAGASLVKGDKVHESEIIAERSMSLAKEMSKVDNENHLYMKI